MEQEPPQELFGGEGHQPLFVLVCIILPAESDFAVGKVHNAVIGDGDTVCVAGQIPENMFGAAERGLCIDYPVLTEQRSKEGVERFRFCEHFHAAGEPEFSRMEGAFESVGELATKDIGQHFHGQEKPVARVDPALVIGPKATGRDHAMDMRMDLEILPPGMQNAEESDLRAQMFGIGRDLQQSRSAGVEQKIVDDLLVL